MVQRKLTRAFPEPTGGARVGQPQTRAGGHIIPGSLFMLGFTLGVLVTLAWVRSGRASGSSNSTAADSRSGGTPPGQKYALLLPIEDMFRVKDRGYVATGEVTTGPIYVGDRVWVSTADRELFFTITEIQTLTGKVERAGQGQRIGVLLEGDGGSELRRGHVLRRASE